MLMISETKAGTPTLDSSSDTVELRLKQKKRWTLNAPKHPPMN